MSKNLFKLAGLAALGLYSSTNNILPNSDELANNNSNNLDLENINLPIININTKTSEHVNYTAQPNENQAARELLWEETNTTENNSSAPELSAECLSVIKDIGLSKKNEELLIDITQKMNSNFSSDDIERIYDDFGHPTADEIDLGMSESKCRSYDASYLVYNRLGISQSQAENLFNEICAKDKSAIPNVISQCIDRKNTTDGMTTDQILGIVFIGLSVLAIGISGVSKCSRGNARTHPSPSPEEAQAVRVQNQQGIEIV